MNVLYIIGNGFDKHHGLHTGYEDFSEFIIHNHTYIENVLAEYFQLGTNDKGLWSDFENDLGTYNWKSFFDEKNYLDFSDERFRPSFVFGLKDNLIQETDELIENIRGAFADWLNQISLESIGKKIDFEDDSIFLNFNYTLTLEEVYKIPNDKIFHVHGDVKNNPDSLIFGHNQKLKEKQELDENGDSIRTMFTDSENTAEYPFYAFQKPVDNIINENKGFFESISSVIEITILGHSLNPVDVPYFEEIVKQTKNILKWKVSFLKEKDKETYLETLLKIGVIKDKIEFFKMK